MELISTNMSHTTIGLFKDKGAAEAAINDLVGAGIPESQVSYIYVTGEGDMKVESAADASTPGEAVADGAVGGATTGAVVGAIAGLAVASGVLPGLGTLFVAGPLATALGLTGGAATTAAGALTGAAAGGIIGALVGFGATDDEAKMYETRIKQGDILVATSADAPAAKEILARHDAEEVREYVKG